MWKNGVIALTLTAFINLTFGCTHNVGVKPEEVNKPEEKITKLALADGKLVKFERPGARYSEANNTIIGITALPDSVGADGRAYKRKPAVYTVSADSVSTVWVSRVDAARTVLCVLAISLIVGLVIVAAVAASEPPAPPPPSSGTESCPFVYSFDGTQYVFDAEPLGGAVCRALQRSEYSKLEHIAPVDGRYRLKLRNEMPETQYLDRIQMYVVDHVAGQQVVPDTSGKMHLIREAVPVAVAIDERGRDISPFLQQEDEMAWQTLMTESELNATTDTRHHLTLEFPKPPDARNAYLIFNAGTALWGSHMIREMMQARGSSIDQWYASVNQLGPRFYELIRFTFREELYLLKMYVRKNGVPEERGLIFGGGPFMTETRFARMDVSDIPGDKLILQFNPPKGFWSLDYLAVQYDFDSTLSPRPCEMVGGQDQTGRSVVDELSAMDARYHVMPDTGNWIELQFSVPPQEAGTERSVFMSTVGYYELHLDKSQPEQKELIDSISRTPGAIAEYSNQKYIEAYRQFKRMQARP